MPVIIVFYVVTLSLLDLVIIIMVPVAAVEGIVAPLSIDFVSTEVSY